MSSKRHPPPDTWPGILCRLPVKSLLRFRCVSKPWQSLIEDPGFARLHLNNFKDNCDETRLLVVEGTRKNCVVRCSVTFAPESETLLTLARDCRIESWRIISSIDGLVLLKGYKPGSSVAFRNLKVWNPSIRKFHELPSLIGADIGLGYDPLAKDYKHVKLIHDGNSLRSVGVYSLGTDSWKIIPFQGKECSWHSDLGSIGCLRTVCSRGSLYFIAWGGVDAGQQSGSHLVSYDLSREVLCPIRKPDVVQYPQLVLIDGGCSLAMFDGTASGRAFDDKSMWVLESSGDGSESMCWTRRYSFRLDYAEDVMHLKKNGVILTKKDQYATLRLKSGGLLLESIQVVLYNPETEEHKIVQATEGSSYSFSDVYAYVESLNLLK